jgi:hypothetical protein
MIELAAAALVGQLTAALHDGAEKHLRDKPSWTVTMQATTEGPRTIEKGDQSNIEDARQVLVRTEAEMRQLWQQHAPNRPMPTIDFSREMVVGVFMGSRPNAGFSTAIISATAANGALIVRYSETKPSAGVVTAQILTFPYHLVAIPKAEVKDVKFEKIP